MRVRVWLLVFGVLAAAIAGGCTRRKLEPQRTGTGGTGPAAADHAGGGGVGGGAGAGDGGASVGVGGLGGIIPRGDPKTNGETCVGGDECTTGFCTDGVCCNTDCAGGCRRCDLPGTVGTCVGLASGARPKTPDACPVEIALTCGNDGTCDGAGACRVRVVGTVCGGGSCDGDAVVGRMVCDGLGNCRAGPSIICVPYRCDPATAACKPGCATDADCIGTYCETCGQCHVRTMASCSSNDQCASGFCAQRLCCNSACDDPCMACNLQNHEGTCWPRPDGCPAGDAGSD